MQEKQDTIQQVEISSTEAGSLAKVSNSEKTPDEFQDIKNQVLETFSELPAIITGFLDNIKSQSSL
jgi:hypothetical protein